MLFHHSPDYIKLNKQGQNLKLKKKMDTFNIQLPNIHKKFFPWVPSNIATTQYPNS